MDITCYTHSRHNAWAPITIQLKAFTHKTFIEVWDKDSKLSRSYNVLETILSERTIELGPGNKGYLPFVLPKKNGMNCLIMNLQALNQVITCTKFKMMTISEIRKTIHPGHWAASLDVRSAYWYITITRRGCCFLHFK